MIEKLFRQERIEAVLLFFSIFALYLCCLYPTIAPRDSADMAAAALTLGVAHPPGYPLYAVLGKAWSLALPLGNPAFRLNVLSALAGAGTCAAVFLVCRRRLGVWASAGACAALAMSAYLGKFSLLSEKYALHALFIAGLLLAADGERASVRRRACLSALLLGLGLVNHPTLLLIVPALLWLWREQYRAHGMSPAADAPGALALFAAGLSLYAFIWIRTGSLPQAWSVISRQEYGTWQLFSGFSRPLSAGSSVGLLAHLAERLIFGTSPLAAVLAICGCYELSRDHRPVGAGLGLAFLFFGPVFFIMTRFDLSEWVARSVLESALIAPAVLACAAAGFGIEAVSREAARRIEGAQMARPRSAAKPVAMLLAAGCVFAGAWGKAPWMDHRMDLSAYDYVSDLRRALPPGCAAAVGGDTALFGLRYLSVVRPQEPARVLAGAVEPDLGRWIERRAGKSPVYVLGLPLKTLRGLGVLRGGSGVVPSGLVQRVGDSPPAGSPWSFSILRKGAAMKSGESYAHDVRLSYAFAHYLTGQLAEARGESRSALAHYARAVLLDPEDYRLQVAGPLNLPGPLAPGDGKE